MGWAESSVVAQMHMLPAQGPLRTLALWSLSVMSVVTVPEGALASTFIQLFALCTHPLLKLPEVSRQKCVLEHCFQTSDQKDCIPGQKICLLTFGDGSSP